MPFPPPQEPIPIVNKHEVKPQLNNPKSPFEKIGKVYLPYIERIRVLRNAGYVNSGNMTPDRIGVDLSGPISIKDRIRLQAKIGSGLNALLKKDHSLKVVTLELGINFNNVDSTRLVFGTNLVGIEFDKPQYDKILANLNELLHGKTLPAKGTNK
jgi:hypothetical protein